MSTSPKAKCPDSLSNFVLFSVCLVLIVVGGIFGAKSVHDLRLRVAEAETSVIAHEIRLNNITAAIALLQEAVANPNPSVTADQLMEIAGLLEQMSMGRDQQLYQMLQALAMHVIQRLDQTDAEVKALADRVKALEARRPVVRERVVVRQVQPRCNNPVVVCDEANSCVRVR